MRNLTIGKLAKQANVTTVTLRYYEKIGLIPRAMRTASGYRHYPPETLGLLFFIQNAKSAGFDLVEILELVRLQSSARSSSKSVKEIVYQKLKTIDDKIASLLSMKSILEELDKSCDGKRKASECPILKTLSGKHCK